MKKLIIKIPDDIFNKALNGRYKCKECFDAITNGIPLPKGHGRLIDADDFFDEFCEIAIEPYINAPTIIEADKEQTE